MKTNFTHKYTEISSEAIKNRINKMLEYRNGINVESAHVKLSFGNRKTGALVPSVSTIPIVDCGNCKVCSKGCYDIKHVCIYPNVQISRANNSAILQQDRKRFFAEIEAQVRFYAFFRWHVGGDIKDLDYLDNVVRIARNIPTCQFLIFTKMYDLVNNYISSNGELPNNLHLIFSDWRNAEFDNPFNLPISSPIWEDGTKGAHTTNKTFLCSGYCEECARINQGCWNAKKGDTILFEAH